jgi:hypothetical protein
MVATSYFQPRVYVGQRGINNFSWGADDMTDLYARLDSALGRPATIRSPTWYWSGSLRVSRPVDLLYDYTIEASNLTKNVVARLPLITDDLDSFLFENTTQTIKNKRITPIDNDLAGVEKFPDHSKAGKFQGSNFKGEGVWESLMHRNLPELRGDTDFGSHAQYTTSVVEESNDGFWIPNPYLTMTQFDPVFKMKVRVPNWSVGTNRLYFGLVTADAILQNDIPFGLGDAAVLAGFRNDDSDFKIFRGQGDGVTSINPYSTNINISQGVFEVEVGFRYQGTQLYYIFNNGEEIQLTSQLPEEDRWMKFHCSIQNTTTTQRKLDVFYGRFETKM